MSEEEVCMREIHLPMLSKVKAVLANCINSALDTVAPPDSQGRIRLFQDLMVVVVGGSAIVEHLAQKGKEPEGWLTDDIDIKMVLSMGANQVIRDQANAFRVYLAEKVLHVCQRFLREHRSPVATCVVGVRMGKTHMYHGTLTDAQKQALIEASGTVRFTLLTMHATYTTSSGSQFRLPIGDLTFFSDKKPHFNMWTTFLRNQQKTYITRRPAYGRGVGWCTWDGFSFYANIDYTLLDSTRMLMNVENLSNTVGVNPTFVDTISPGTMTTVVSDTRKYHKYMLKVIQLLEMRGLLDITDVARAQSDVRRHAETFLIMLQGSYSNKEYISTLLDMHDAMKKTEVFMVLDKHGYVAATTGFFKPYMGGGSTPSRKTMFSFGAQEDGFALFQSEDPSFLARDARNMLIELRRLPKRSGARSGTRGSRIE